MKDADFCQTHRRNKMPVTRVTQVVVERTLTLDFPAVSPPKGPLPPRVGGRHDHAVPGHVEHGRGRPESAGAGAEPIACHGEQFS